MLPTDQLHSVLTDIFFQAKVCKILTVYMFSPVFIQLLEVLRSCILKSVSVA